MAKTFDFNALTQQTLETRLDAATVIHVTTPPEKLIEQLATSQEEMTALYQADGNGVEKVRAAYELAANLMSCNTEGLQLTAEDLRDKYHINPVALAAYIPAYMDFINEFHTAKN